MHLNSAPLWAPERSTATQLTWLAEVVGQPLALALKTASSDIRVALELLIPASAYSHHLSRAPAGHTADPATSASSSRCLPGCSLGLKDTYSHFHLDEDLLPKWRVLAASCPAVLCRLPRPACMVLP